MTVPPGVSSGHTGKDWPHLYARCKICAIFSKICASGGWFRQRITRMKHEATRSSLKTTVHEDVIPSGSVRFCRPTQCNITAHCAARTPPGVPLQSSRQPKIISYNSPEPRCSVIVLRSSQGVRPEKRAIFPATCVERHPTDLR